MGYPIDTPYREEYIIREYDPASPNANKFQGFHADGKTEATLLCKDAKEVKTLIDEYIRVTNNPSPYG